MYKKYLSTLTTSYSVLSQLMQRRIDVKMVYKRAYHKRLPSCLIFTVKVYTAYLLGARGLSFRSEAVIEILARVDRQNLDRGFATKIIKKNLWHSE